MLSSAVCGAACSLVELPVCRQEKLLSLIADLYMPDGSLYYNCSCLNRPSHGV